MRWLQRGAFAEPIAQATRGGRVHLRVVQGGMHDLDELDRHEGESGVREVLGPERPRTRADCAGGQRPCPWVSCRHHLLLEVQPGGGLKVNFPDADPTRMRETCALDVAERGPVTLEETGRLMNVTRERVRQIEARVLARVREDGQLTREMIGDFVDPGRA